MLQTLELSEVVNFPGASLLRALSLMAIAAIQVIPSIYLNISVQDDRTSEHLLVFPLIVLQPAIDTHRNIDRIRTDEDPPR